MIPPIDRFDQRVDRHIFSRREVARDPVGVKDERLEEAVKDGFVRRRLGLLKRF